MKMAVMGLRMNLNQFLVLVAVNAFVGALIGLERSIVPALSVSEFGLTRYTGTLSFIAVFGVSKALTNYLSGHLSERIGRKKTLVLGWLLGAPVPVLLYWAPSWSWVLAANALLGVNQGLTWSTTVIMKIDLVGPRHRGLAMGFNECSGYLAMAGSAYFTNLLAVSVGYRSALLYPGLCFVGLGLLLSALVVRDTRAHVQLESTLYAHQQEGRRRPRLFDLLQTGFVNNLNDGMAWGLFPFVFSAAGLSLKEVGALIALYPAVWALSQLATGALSDHWGRTPFIVGGMLTQAAGILFVAESQRLLGFTIGSILLGLGTAMVYPTLLAAISDRVAPAARAGAIGGYRFWRDSGYVAGALFAGVLADLVGLHAAVLATAGLTFLSAIVAGLFATQTKYSHS